MKGHDDRLTIWLLEKAGYVRNPEWPSKHEIEYCHPDTCPEFKCLERK